MRPAEYLPLMCGGLFVCPAKYLPFGEQCVAYVTQRPEEPSVQADRTICPVNLRGVFDIHGTIRYGTSPVGGDV